VPNEGTTWRLVQLDVEIEKDIIQILRDVRVTHGKRRPTKAKKTVRHTGAKTSALLILPRTTATYYYDCTTTTTNPTVFLFYFPKRHYEY
jgi:hypothetical protein